MAIARILLFLAFLWPVRVYAGWDIHVRADKFTYSSCLSTINRGLHYNDRVVRCLSTDVIRKIQFDFVIPATSGTDNLKAKFRIHYEADNSSPGTFLWNITSVAPNNGSISMPVPTPGSGQSIGIIDVSSSNTLTTRRVTAYSPLIDIIDAAPGVSCSSGVCSCTKSGCSGRKARVNIIDLNSAISTVDIRDVEIYVQ